MVTGCRVLAMCKSLACLYDGHSSCGVLMFLTFAVMPPGSSDTLIQSSALVQPLKSHTSQIIGTQEPSQPPLDIHRHLLSSQAKQTSSPQACTACTAETRQQILPSLNAAPPLRNEYLPSGITACTADSTCSIRTCCILNMHCRTRGSTQHTGCMSRTPHRLQAPGCLQMGSSCSSCMRHSSACRR